MDKSCKLEILPSAQAELEEIARVHMALSGTQSARRITDKIYDALEQLTRFPLSGPPVRDEQLRAAGYRYILADSYLVIYRLLGDTIFVYHIPHGASDYPKLFRTSFFWVIFFFRLRFLFSCISVQSVLTPIFDRYGISRAVLFVSVAKGTATAKSDLDLLVDSKLRGLKVDVFNLSQLGKLCRVADDAFTKAHPEIPWREMYGLRNRIVHDYEGVNLMPVWEIVSENLPDLQNKLKQLL